MATLQKTYTGDLSTAIADVLLTRIKELDNEDANASKEVKSAAKELKDDDSPSISVRDENLRRTVLNIFQPLEGKILNTKNQFENLSTKTNILAGGVADTQKLLVSQNQLLENKFDIILKNIGSIASIDRKNEAESQLDRIEAQLEKGFDLSGTFAYEKTRTGAFGIFGKILSGILGNRFTASLIAQISKSLIPRTVRARAKLVRLSSIGAAKRLAKKFSRPGTGIAKRFLTPFGLYGGKKLSSIVAKKLPARIASLDVGAVSIERFLFGRSAKSLSERTFGKAFAQFGKNALLKGQKLNSIDAIADFVIQGRRDTIAKELFQQMTIGGQKVARKGVRKKVQKKLAKDVTKGVTKKTGQKVINKQLGNLDGVFIKAMSNPQIQEAIVRKIGTEGAEKIGVKVASSATKGGFPIFGTAYAFIEGVVRLAMGDPEGMALSFGSGIPAAGWGFAIIDILRDIDKEAYNKNLRPNLPIPSDANIAGFFQDAFGIGPSQYEMGNVDSINVPMGMGNNVNAIAQLLSVTKSFANATGFGAEANSLIGESGLSSYTIPKANYNFDVGSINTKKDVETTSASERDEELRIVRKKEKEKNEEVEEENKEKSETRRKDGKPEGKNQWWDFMDRFANPADKGKGGIGGDVTPKTPIMGGDGATIEFYGQQGRDRSGEPGVDFSFRDFKNNYNLFPGYVLETGLLYGKGYGNVVVIRSVDPSNGQQFDALYSHFPDGGIAVKVGQQVSAGELLGSVGFVSVDTPGVPQIQPNNAGNMSGWHTSVDFFEPDSAARYGNADALINLVTGAANQTPSGLLEKLKPVTKNNETSLNSIGSNNKLASTMTNMVENGSSERLMQQRQVARKNPIVIVNNQVVNSPTSSVIFSDTRNVEENFFEAYNLAKHTV